MKNIGNGFFLKRKNPYYIQPFFPKAIHVYLLLSTTAILLSNWNIFVFTGASVLLALLCFVSVRGDIYHPLVCYFPILVIYTVAYPLLKASGYEPNIRSVGEAVSSFSIVISWCSLMTVALILMTTRCKEEKEYNRNSENLSGLMMYIGYLASFLVAAVFYFYLYKKGFVSKQSIAADNSLIHRLGSMGMTVNPIFMFLLVAKLRNKFSKLIVIVLSLFNGVLALAFSGERNIVLTVIFFTIFSFRYSFGFRKRTIYLIGVLAMVFLTFSASLKLFGSKGASLQGEDPFWVKFLMSDFSAAGFNLDNLVRTQGEWSYKWGSSFLYDFLSPVRNIIPGLTDLSSARWNQAFFWPTHKTGQGFTIIGEGFVNFGLLGSIGWMAIISLGIRHLYYQSSKSPMLFTFYTFSIIMIAYASRADLANVISPLVKYMLTIAVANRAALFFERKIKS